MNNKGKDKNIKKLEKLIKDKKPVSDKLVRKILKQTVPSNLIRTEEEIKLKRLAMKDKITNFEELIKAVDELLGCKTTSTIFGEAGEAMTYTSNGLLHEEDLLHIDYYIKRSSYQIRVWKFKTGFITLTEETTDPNKILKVIKSIKECEDER